MRVINSHQQGFTLLEILMVVSLMALLTGIFLSFTLPSSDKALKVDAEQFINQLDSAMVQASGLNEIIALAVSSQRYQFFRLNLGQESFVPLERFEAVELGLEQSLAISMTEPDIEWALTSAKAAYEDFIFENPESTVVLLLPAGDIKPAFELTFTDSSGAIRVVVDAQGGIKSPFSDTDAETPAAAVAEGAGI